MNKIIIIIIALVFSYTLVNASVPDTVVMVSGKVVSKEDNSPVKATIEYKKLPYGSEIGKITSNENGEYRIYIHGGSKYSFKVSSKGHFAHVEQLDIVSTGINNKDIALSSGDVDYVFRLNNLIFELGKAEITEASHAELNGLVDRLNEFPKMVIQLEGHTDTRGDAQQNMKLSQDRVESVKFYLISKGINGERIMTKAFGGTKPLATDNGDESHALNRRVEVRIISMN